MGYALKLNNVDFSDVAVDQVTFEDSVPCTSISLNQSTLSFETVGQKITLTATPTPANTTDNIIWSTSDASIASVSNGQVTIHGIGDATITVTCGSKTATATINQTSIKPVGTFFILEGWQPYFHENPSLINLDQSSTRYAIGKVYTGNDELRVSGGETRGIECIPVPYGATTVKIATENDNTITVDYIYIADRENLVVYYDQNYPEYTERKSTIGSKTGTSVEYGQCIMFAISTSAADTPTYVYFE